MLNQMSGGLLGDRRSVNRRYPPQYGNAAAEIEIGARDAGQAGVD